MKKLTAFFGLLSICTLSQADDTEIYGANAIDPDARVNANVMFIMDTSGSMNTNVTTTLFPYDENTDYSGRYDSDKIYSSLNSSSSGGHDKSAFSEPESNDCTNVLTNIENNGKVEGNFYQLRKWGRRYYWSSLQSGSDEAITCDNGYTYWLYSGNYMNWYNDNANTTNKSRLETVVDVLNELTYSLDNINLGLMRFDRSAHGGMVDVPVTDIATSGSLIRAKLDDYLGDFGGNTPLSETMYEAALYYRGEEWEWGSSSSPNHSVSSSLNGSNYKSPIESECQKNHIILLTDGEPTSDTSSNEDIQERIADMTNFPASLSKSCESSGGCLDELTYWLKNTDNSFGSSGLIGTQDVTTYTIGGFDLEGGVALLTRAAELGGGRYYPADDTQGLIKALDSIFLDILATDSTFTAPAVSVNAFNASEHRDELFYALFRPADNAKWAGNLKKYKLLSDGTVVGTDDAVPAVSDSTGFFNESIFDYWNITDTPDGKNVELGGMANKMTADPATRNILSNNDNSDDQTLLSFTATASGSVASKTSFGIDDEDEFNQVHEWSMGIDVLDRNGDGDYTDSRKSIGDPLHSEPLIVTYGGTEASPISSIFFGTNEGFLHSLDTITGVENFAFIPKELHSIQKTYFDNTSSASEKPYGLDGAISTWFYDKNNNNVLLDSSGVLETNEHAYIYSGMRRGGRNYYALDVTDRTVPSMKFMIEGGVGNFERLGETWSKMTVAKVKFNNEDKFVAFFGGGYDSGQDGYNVATPDSVGNAIYMVDASNGDLLWWSSNADAHLNIGTMDNSIPASISAIDISGDGYINYLFAADTGGRVFRIDINKGNSGASDFAKGGEIASLAGSDAANNRRFYNKPNVSLVKDKQNGDYLTISIGSGFRAHPITVKDVKNRFYLIKDFNPYNAPTSYASKSEEALDKTSLLDDEDPDPLKLYNATNLMTGGSDALTDDLKRIMTLGGGWYVEMVNEGEKVLAESTTFAGAIIFTTFSPSSVASSSSCGADTGQSRIYALNQKWATAAIDLDGDGDTDIDDASSTLAHSGIAPRPVVIYRQGGGKTIAIGTETIDDSRFEQEESSETCEADGNCEEQVSKCETENCYVTPVYWRQNDD